MHLVCHGQTSVASCYLIIARIAYAQYEDSIKARIHMLQLPYLHLFTFFYNKVTDHDINTKYLLYDLPIYICQNQASTGSFLALSFQDVDALNLFHGYNRFKSHPCLQ